MSGNEKAEVTAIPVVAAVIKREDGKYLICKRSGNDDSPSSKNFVGMWEFPGGKVREIDRESDQAALRREITKELIAHIMVGKFIYKDMVIGDKDVKVYEVKFYQCYLDGVIEPVATMAHSEIRWVEVDEMQGYEMTPLSQLTAEILKTQSTLSSLSLLQTRQYHSQDTPMVQFDPRAAQKEKWRRGQEKYGPGSLPINPLAHLYEELIDGLNYLDDAQRQQHITAAEHQLNTASLRAMAYWARGAHFQREKEK